MRQALGKGLDALLSGGTSYQDGGGIKQNIQKVPLDKIIPNRYQPRKNFNEESLKELASSIQKHGLTQPIVVAYDGGLDKYEIIVGERRFRASQMANLGEIDCIVHNNIEEKQLCALALIENIQRENLNPIETALGYKNLMQKFHVSQAEIGEYCGKSKAAVSNSLRLLSLSENIQKSIAENEISEGHARTLLMLPEGLKREALYRKIVYLQMSVRQAEKTAKNMLEPKAQKKSKKSADILAFEDSLEQSLGTKVELNYKQNEKKGVLIIHYNSLEQLESITDKLSRI